MFTLSNLLPSVVLFCCMSILCTYIESNKKTDSDSLSVYRYLANRADSDSDSDIALGLSLNVASFFLKLHMLAPPEDEEAMSRAGCKNPG